MSGTDTTSIATTADGTESKERKKRMKTRLLLLIGLLFASTSVFAGVHWSVGIGVGGYCPPPPVAVYAPPAPGPGYAWVGGYYYPVGPRYVWHAGYWAHPPFAGAHWVAPRYYGHRYYGGYWHRH
jgi:hypothetical protein